MHPVSGDESLGGMGQRAWSMEGNIRHQVIGSLGHYVALRLDHCIVTLS